MLIGEDAMPANRSGWLRAAPRTVIATVSSDVHTWNLMFLQLLLEERGHLVHNTGPCSSVRHVVDACRDHGADLLLLSSLNGHGILEAPDYAAAVRQDPGLVTPRMVIGGSLNLRGALDHQEVSSLRESGFDEVFCSPTALQDFRTYLSTLERTLRPRARQKV
jgi:methylaspartate mutase sigma subunit